MAPMLLPGAPAPLSSEGQLIGVLLSLEHSLLFGSQSARGIAATHAAARDTIDLLDECVHAHRDQRDMLNDLMDRWHQSAPVASAAYMLPSAPPDVAGALTIAQSLEDRCTATYLEAIGKTKDPGTRHLCLVAMQASAVRTARLRILRGEALEKASVTFPGR